MCDISMALGIGASLIGGIGQIEQGKATANAAKYNAQVAEMNATLADRQAKDAIARGQQEEQQKRMQTAQLMGKQRVAAAANNLDLSFGSPLDTIVDAAKMGEIDALNIRTNAYRESYGHTVDAVNTRAGATLEKYKAKNAETAGYLGAFGTILGGAGDAYGKMKNPSLGYGGGAGR
jgi:hypothetical protein